MITGSIVVKLRVEMFLKGYQCHEKIGWKLHLGIQKMFQRKNRLYGIKRSFIGACSLIFRKDTHK